MSTITVSLVFFLNISMSGSGDEFLDRLGL